MKNSAPIYPNLLPSNSQRSVQHHSHDQQQHLSSRTIYIDDRIVSDIPFESTNHGNQDVYRWKDIDKGVLKPSDPSPRLCCCFQTKRGSVVTLTTILLGLGLVLFFLFPRIPSFKIGDPFVNDQNGLRFNVSNDRIVTAMSYQIAINFTVESKNYFDFYTSSIIVTVMSEVCPQDSHLLYTGQSHEPG